MAITLIPEDGTVVTNANTYASLVYARDFAEQMGLTLPATDEAAKSALLQAMPYIESQPYQGQRANPLQALSWPRKLVSADGVDVASNVVPAAILKAQVQAAADITAGVELFASSVSGQLITKEKVGPIETEYSDEYLANWNGAPEFPAIDVYLKPYLIYIGGYRLTPAIGF